MGYCASWIIPVGDGMSAKTIRRATSMLRGEADGEDRHQRRGELQPTCWYACPRCFAPWDGMRGEECTCDRCGMISRWPIVRDE